MRPPGEVRIGCSGWNYKDWRGLVYPPGLPPRRWLEHYATLFDTVEVNNTFYRLPTRSAVAGWADGSPPGFLFAVKMSRYLTHIKRLTEVERGIELFYERLDPLVRSPKLGPVLWQLPPTFKRNDERLAATLTLLPPGRHCFEFREPSWFVPEVYELLSAHVAALVIGDDARRPVGAHERTTAWTFVRFHYGARGRRGNYSESELDEWAARIEKWRAAGDVFVYFNNDWEGFAVQNGLWLKRRLGL